MLRRPAHLWFVIALLLSALPAASEILIQGRLGGSGAPPPDGTRLRLEPYGDRYELALHRLAAIRSSESVDETSPDADGFFELSAPEPGLWRVVVEAPEWRSMSFSLRPLLVSIVLPPLALERAVPVEVHVTGGDAQPVAAAVGLYDRQGRSGSWTRRYQLVHTGDDGIARLVRGASEKIALQAAALDPEAGLALRLTQEVDPGSSGTVRLRLGTGVTGTLHVVDTAGHAAADAVVFQGNGLVPLGKTGDDGRLRVTLSTASVSTWSLGPGAASAQLAGDFFKDGVETEVTLQPARVLRGRVLDQESGEGLAGALVAPSWYRIALTRQGGEFTVDVPVVEVRDQLAVRASAPGYGWVWERLDLKDGWPDDLRLVLPPASAVTGVVVDTDGRPVAGASLHARPATSADMEAVQSFARHASRWRTRSARDGRFEIHTLAPRAGYQVVCEKAGFATARHTVEAFDPTTRQADLRVVLVAGTTAVGQVVDEGGQGVAGARVTLRPAPLTDDPRRAVVYPLPDEKSAAEHSSDAEGTFRVPDLALGRYDLSVRAAGFAPALIPGLEIGGGPGEVDLGTVELTVGAAFTGRVVDADGVAVAEAAVQARRGEPTWSAFNPPASPQVTTAADGTFEISELRPGEHWVLMASKEGYSPTALRLVAETSAEPLEIVLQPGGRISGRVVDGEGQPLEAVQVWSISQDRDLRHGSAPTTRSADDGRFALAGVPAGPVTLSASKEGYRAVADRDVEIAAGTEMSGVEIVLQPGITFTGTVRRQDGEGAAQAWVRVEQRSARHNSTTSTNTDEAGLYRIEGLAPGRYALAAGMNPADSGSEPLTVDAEGGVYTVDLLVTAGAEVSGLVADTSGLPVAGAVMGLVPAADSRRHYMGDFGEGVRSGGDGAFAFHDVSPGRYGVTARKEGYATAVPADPIAVDAAGVTGVAIEMKRGATLRGRVLGLELDELADLALQVHMNQEVFQVQDWRRGQVDYDGRYAVLNLAAGRWTLVANAAGRQLTRQIEVAEGDVEVVEDLEFKTGFTLRGTIVSSSLASGEVPLAGANVYVRSLEAVESFSDSTDSQGRFRISEVPTGRYQLTARRDGLYHAREIEVFADEELRIEIATSWISGIVRDTRGLAVEGATLGLEPVLSGVGQLRNFVSSSSTAVSDAEGRFQLLQVPGGTWQVTARKEGYATAAVTVDLTSDAPVEGLALEMTPASGLTFRVQLKTGEVPANVQLAVFDTAGRRVALEHLSPSTDGQVRVTTVPDGSWMLRVWSARNLTPDMAFTAPGDLGTIVLQRGGRLSVKVGELKEDEDIASLELRTPQGRLYPAYMGYRFGIEPGTWPTYRGEAGIPFLLPGLWSFTITHKDGRTWSGQASVTAGETAEVRLP